MSLVHWVIVLIIVLIVFGPTRLGAIGKALGRGVRTFRKRLTEDDSQNPPR